MSAAYERDFSDFHFGDNVYELAGGVIPEIARRLDVSLGTEPNSADLQTVMSKIGPNKVLRQNEEITAIDRETMVGLVEVSGVQQALNRSLLSPEVPVDRSTTDAIVVVGGVANWMDRTAALVQSKGLDKPVYSVAGNRVMDSATEKTNPNVVRMQEAFGRYPTEAQYAANIVIPRLVVAMLDVMTSKAETQDGDELFRNLLRENPELLDKRLALGRTANAGVIMAIQLRNAAQETDNDFDTDPTDPQVLVMTDSLPVARTEEQEADSRNYQKAATALRQVVLTAKKLHEAAGGE